MYIINIETGMPTVEEARERLKTALLKAKKENRRVEARNQELETSN